MFKFSIGEKILLNAIKDISKNALDAKNKISEDDKLSNEQSSKFKSRNNKKIAGNIASSIGSDFDLNRENSELKKILKKGKFYENSIYSNMISENTLINNLINKSAEKSVIYILIYSRHNKFT